MTANYHVRSLAEHLDASRTPKRILALDGGGVRGALTLEYLAKIETILRSRHGGADAFRLSHYFDLIGGTSTGAIIASLLALGKSVREIQDLYRALANEVFRRSWFRWGAIRHKFDEGALERALRSQLGEYTTLGSADMQTGLMVVAKRYDTTSTWPLNNNPLGTYYASEPQSVHIANSDYPLWKVVRASTAAPSYFKPEEIIVAAPRVDGIKKPVVGQFVDGGVSVANNPALQALHTAALDGFKLRWPLGAENLLLVSIGTGSRNPSRPATWWTRLHSKISALHAVNALLSIMDDASAHVETILQWMSDSPTARVIDAEIGSLEKDRLAGAPLISYLRYNVELSPKWMAEHLKAIYSDEYLRGLEAMDDAAKVPDLAALGARAAEKQVDAAHFPTRFDLT